MRTLTPTDSFIRDLQKFLKRHRDLSVKVETILALLEDDVYTSILHTHKLHGRLSKSYACKIDH